MVRVTCNVSTIPSFEHSKEDRLKEKLKKRFPKLFSEKMGCIKNASNLVVVPKGDPPIDTRDYT